MKKAIINVFAILSVSVIFTSCSLISKEESTINSLGNTPTSIFISSNHRENTPESNTYAPSSYEFLSPTVISNKSKTMRFEVSASLSKSTFIFRIDAFLPSEFEFAYPDYIYPDIYDEIDLSFNPAIEIEPMGGGGGSGALEDVFNLNTQAEYRVKSAILDGQVVNLIAVVDFGEFTEITNPVTFEFSLIAQ
ncbi:MAG: hypothetical protein HZB18_00870 [Chloroflexi bacterium]|nr:hypothetical protein [Chloroflexota bacterium]